MVTAPAEPDRRWSRAGLRVLIFVVVAGVSGAAWCVYQSISTASHAEMALHATQEVCELTSQYVREHDGRWPRSWQELEQLDSPPGKFNLFPWPEKSTDLQEFVTIDFTADPDQLANQTIDDFEAIKPIGPYFPYKGYGEVRSLLESLRATRKANNVTEAPSP